MPFKSVEYFNTVKDISELLPNIVRILSNKTAMHIIDVMLNKRDIKQVTAIPPVISD